MAGVSLPGIVKADGTFRVEHWFDLEVKETEFVAPVGCSGRCRPTALRVIAGLEETGAERDVHFFTESYLVDSIGADKLVGVGWPLPANVPSQTGREIDPAGVGMDETARRPVGTCLTARFPEDDPRQIFHVVDDRDYGADLYFADADENAFKVVAMKPARRNN